MADFNSGAKLLKKLRGTNLKTNFFLFFRSQSRNNCVARLPCARSLG